MQGVHGMPRILSTPISGHVVHDTHRISIARLCVTVMFLTSIDNKPPRVSKQDGEGP